MKPKFTIQTKINRPLETVFSAVQQADQIDKYFVDVASASIEEGVDLTWTWNSCGAYPVTVKQIIPNNLIVIEWDGNPRDYKTLATLNFESTGANETLIKISEEGWPDSESGRKASYENCAGWQHMMLCLKAYLEHQIDLRK